MSKIQDVIEHIKSQTSLCVIEDSYFNGLRRHKNNLYFNIEVDRIVSECREFPILKRMCEKSKVINRVEAGGCKRIAIFLN